MEKLKIAVGAKLTKMVTLNRTRAGVYTIVKTVLDELPRAYTTELYEQKCDTVYQHVYDSYQGEG